MRFRRHARSNYGNLCPDCLEVVCECKRAPSPVRTKPAPSEPAERSGHWITFELTDEQFSRAMDPDGVELTALGPATVEGFVVTHKGQELREQVHPLVLAAHDTLTVTYTITAVHTS